MKGHLQTEGINDEWLTPPEILRNLGSFDLDPAAANNRPWDCAAHNYTIDDDGLLKDWFGRVWLNPPFNRYVRPKLMAKMADHGNGIMLIPGATETAAFCKYVWGVADAVLFVESRPHFHLITGKRADFNCGTNICLVAYGSDNVQYLIDSGLGVVVRELNKSS